MAIEEDFCLLGVVSDEPDYRLCWLINQALGTAFMKQEDLTVYHKKHGADQSFSIFSFLDEEACLTFRIIRNRSDAGYFLDELKNLDYLVHIQGEIYHDKISDFLQGMTSIGGIRMGIPVDLAKIRNKERLLLW